MYLSKYSLKPFIATGISLEGVLKYGKIQLIRLGQRLRVYFAKFVEAIVHLGL